MAWTGLIRGSIPKKAKVRDQHKSTTTTDCHFLLKQKTWIALPLTMGLVREKQKGKKPFLCV